MDEKVWLGIVLGVIVSSVIIWTFSLSGITALLVIAVASFGVVSGFSEHNNAETGRFWGEVFAAFAIIGITSMLIIGSL